MTSSQEHPAHHSFWLKCWPEESTQGSACVWRFSLEDPQAGQRMGFASLHALTLFLERQTRSWSQGEEKPDDSSS
jgi:hypothetical protein